MAAINFYLAWSWSSRPDVCTTILIRRLTPDRRRRSTVRVIYFDMDSTRPDHLGCYGYPRNTSPTIDRIARDAIIFHNCYTSDAPCLPSRSALFSGRFGIHNGVVGHAGAAAHMRYPGDGHQTDPTLLPLPMALSRVGVKTITFTTFAQRHLAWHFYAGWDEIHKTNNKNGGETAEEVNASVLPWLRAHGADDGYFLHINYWDPHTNYRTPLDYGNPFEQELPPGWLTDEIIQEQWRSYSIFGARDMPDRQARFPRHPRQIANVGDWKQWIDGYDTAIRYMDDHIGQVLDVLDSLGVL